MSTHTDSPLTPQPTIRLTLAQALVRYLAALRIQQADGQIVPYCAGVWAIFGHGNVVGLGEALQAKREELPTYRAHNEQAMAHSAIAFAKAHCRQRIMAVTTSIGPGATNLVTAAALAHVNRLPLLLLPGDTFASRAPDPVLQQVESFSYGDMTANDTLRPVVRYFDRIMRPEQLLTALPRAIQTMVDPATCGPVCLALPQDVQAQAFDFPLSFFSPALLYLRRPQPDAQEFAQALAALKAAKRPVIVAGGGVLYAQASEALREFSKRLGIPVTETQAGKSAMAWDDALNLGAVGVTGSPASYAVVQEADLVIAIGTRLQDFNTGSNTLFAHCQVLGINVQGVDAGKTTLPLVADARVALEQLLAGCGKWVATPEWTAKARQAADHWRDQVTALTCADPGITQPPTLPYDAEVIGRVRDSSAHSPSKDIVVGAAGTLPAELHKHWRSSVPGSYHVEYGYSCMGYEIAGGLGVKLAKPDREVIVMVGDGSYMMMNSEIASSIMLGLKLIIVVQDNRGFGCISRLQAGTGGAAFNNLLPDCVALNGEDVHIDFASHARSMGAHSVHVKNVGELGAAMVAARRATRTQVIVIDTTHTRFTEDVGPWWEVGVPEVSERPSVLAARQKMLAGKARQKRQTS
jgi:3D-(3,5/4)-trihydroxycyclohexane-1,2-dione acylhydrolase (decyclizing)